MLALDIKKSAKKNLDKLHPKHQRQVAERIEELLNNPQPHDSVLMKQTDNIYSNTIGEYRIIYKFNEEILTIGIIERRGDDRAYRAFKRMKDF